MKPYYEDDAVEIYLGDCLELLPEIRADIVVSDPPYNCGKPYGPNTDDRRGWQEWAAWLDNRLTPSLAAAPLGALFFLSQPAYRHYCRFGERDIDWSAVWYKPFSAAICAAAFMPHWEHLVYMGPKRRKPPDLGWGSDVFVANVEVGGHQPAIPVARNGHPTPKPIALMREIAMRLHDAETLLDPFMGSGTTLRAAKDVGKKAIGIEIEERWCELAAKRMAQAVLPLAAATQKGRP